MPRPPRPRICATPGCPADTDPGQTYCPDHTIEPWSQSTWTKPPGWTRTTRRVLTRDQRTCYQCGQPATAVDHITPKAEGGSDDDTNLAAICPTCHTRKTAAEATRARTRAH